MPPSWTRCSLLTVPPAVTAATGADALTTAWRPPTGSHTPWWMPTPSRASELVGAYLARAVAMAATWKLVRDVPGQPSRAVPGRKGTGAVHALAYPLGGEFHVAHGLSNALLLPHVMKHNLPAMPERYADVAIALGATPADTPAETARRGLDRLAALYRECGLDTSLSDLGVPEGALPGMAQSAMKVTRLLKNNPAEITVADAEAIYRAAY